MKYSISTLCLLLKISILCAQPNTAPLNSPTYSLVDRLSVLTGENEGIHGGIKPISRENVAKFSEKLNRTAAQLSTKDLFGVRYLLVDNVNWLSDSNIVLARSIPGPKGWFYKTPAHFFTLRRPHFQFNINPIIQFEVGRETDDKEIIFGNRRGIELSGEIDNKVWFYTNLIEQQARFPTYVNDRINKYYTIPNAGNYKTYSSKIFDITNGYDYNTAQAYIGVKATKHIGVQFGHGTHFIGHGYRSLLISDVGNNAFFLKFNTRVWRFHYQNLFMELSPFSTYNNPNNGTTYLLPKKYVAIHYLDFKVTPKFSIGVFEGTAMNRSSQFEFQYLNPVIFYRSIEGMIGSPDNVILGLNTHWDVFNRIRLYGQFLVDEFYFREVYKPEKTGWWGNKYGLQAGFQYFNAFGIKNLDLRGEYNVVRPYTYQHYDSLNNWSHYNQALAHPLGANFRETIATIRYQPHYKVNLMARFIQYTTGEDAANENWGSNILYSYLTREQDYGNTIGQGSRAKINLIGAQVSYQLFHNCFVDFNVLSRRHNSNNPNFNRSTNTFSTGMRLNFWSPYQDY